MFTLRVVLCALLAPVVLLAEQPPLIPLKDFFRNPDTTGYQLSPDGSHVSFLAPWQSRMNLMIQPLGDPDAEPRRVTSETDRDIAGYVWAGTDRLVYLQDQDGNENTHLYAVDLDTDTTRPLTPFDGVRVGLIDDLENDPSRMIVQMNRRNPQLFDAYALELDTGELTLLAENPGNVVGWQTDHSGAIRLAYVSDGLNTEVLYRSDAEADWESIVQSSWKNIFSVQQFTYDNRAFWALSSLGRDRAALVLWDPQTQSEREVLYSHPQVDVGGAFTSDVQEQLLGVSFAAAKQHYVFFDAATEEEYRWLQEQFPGLELRFVDATEDETLALIRTFSDRSLGAFHLFDRENRELTHLAEVSPWLPEAQLSPMRPITYTSRDGLFIHGYLTLPQGEAPAAGWPAILIPHGGPIARDNWGYSPTIQFLANRGYAILQVNFRGSSGYGRSFMEAGLGEWGRAMQDDLTDGVAWLIDQGFADPERVGIFGGSYGGYAALAGMAFTPERYTAGISYVGPSNLFTLMDSIPPYWEPFREQLYEMIGHPQTDAKRIQAVSPLFHVERIERPLMILQGANDPRVKQAESDQIVRALRERGISVPYMLKEDEGHGFRNEENRFAVYRAIEEFFGEHLGGRVEEGAALLPGLKQTAVAELPEPTLEAGAEAEGPASD